MTSIVTIVSAIVIVNQSFFFSFMGLLGIDYKGAEESSVYAIFLVSMFLLTLVFYIYSVFKKGFIKGESTVLGIIFFFVFIHLWWVLFDSEGTELIPQFMIFSFVLGFVGLFAAAVVVKLGLLGRLIKTLELVFIVQGTGIFVYSVFSTLSGSIVRSLAGATYQALSYYAAFTMGMLMVYNFILPLNQRFRICHSMAYRFFSYALIFACVLGVLTGGGRGAFILMLLYIMLTLFYALSTDEKLSIRKVGNTFGKLVIIGVGIFLFFIFFSEQTFVQDGFRRAVQFITHDGVDLVGGSSGRNEVYKIAIDYITQQPALGYGPFGIRDKTIHAHNFFLEIWLQFGISVFLILPVILGFIVRRLKRFDHDSGLGVWCLFLSLYPMVMTQFSGSYLAVSNLWFVIGVILMASRKPAQY